MFYSAMGIFVNYTLILLFGFTFIETAVTIKILNFLRTVVVSIIFVYLGKVNYWAAIFLLLGGIMGACLGVHFVEKIGEKRVKSLFILVVLASVVKMLFF